MNEDHLIKNLLEKISDLLPKDAQYIGSEFKESLKPLVESTFQKLKIITKEEFKPHLLQLERLEEKVLKLEESLNEINNK